MNTEAPKPRRRLFQRLQEDLPPLQITKRDLRILELVRDYRFLNTEQIRALVGGSGHNVTERLSRLFHHAYLDRPAHQRELRTEGYRIMIYALAPKGARILCRRSGMHVHVPHHLGEDNRSAKRFHLLHTLMVSQFRACLTLACREHPGVELSSWQVPETRLSRVLVDRRPVAIIPDAYFTLGRADGQCAHFFLEADRGTMTRARFLRKLQAYWRLRSGSNDGTIPSAFRVLTVTRSWKRTTSLRTAAIDADPRRRGSHMFYFTTEGTYDLDHPESVLDEIWRTPVDSEIHSLLEGKRRST